MYVKACKVMYIIYTSAVGNEEDIYEYTTQCRVHINRYYIHASIHWKNIIIIGAKRFSVVPFSLSYAAV